MKPIRLGLIGVGKIARDQHLPAMRANPSFALVACASRHAKVDGAENFLTLEDMLEHRDDIDAVVICTPPQVHYVAANLALAHGKHVLLEKPPCITPTELDCLAIQSRAVGRTLFQTWHSRYAKGVGPAELWLRQRRISRITVTWKEDVRRWHPGQAWIWEAGGFGIFDPGINALSILTKILPEPFFVKSADLFVPENCQAPIAADMLFTTVTGIEINAAFDFRHTGLQRWDIEIDTDMGPMKLSAGGSTLEISREDFRIERGRLHEGEYPALYRRFAELIKSRESDVDARPFQLVADVFLAARRFIVEPFEY